MQLAIRKKTTANGTSVLVLEGGIVVGRCAELEKQVAALASSGQCVVFDLAGVTMLDSAGVGALVACFTMMKKAGGDLRIAGATGKTYAVLRMTQINKVISMFPDSEAASA